MIKYSLRQFIFGSRVFFRKPSLKNCIKIAKFIWKREILGKPIPFSVVLALTYKCQCNCLHCSVGDYGKKANELSIKELKSLFDFIDSWGPIKVTFFGGEPLLRDGITELTRYASSKGIRTSIDTNGILLDEDMVLNLKKAGISNINVSVDSHGENTHDLLRQKKGCFTAAINGLKLCLKYKIPCLISTYASRRSIKEKDLENIVILARRIGVNGVKILFPILSGKWRETEEERLNIQEEHYVERLLDPSFVYIEDALEMLKKRGKGCSALERNLIYISPYGDVQPCPAIPISFGNIRNEKISNIIQKMHNHIFFKKYHSCKTCLMNERDFRKEFFSIRNNREIPIDVQEIKL